MQYVTTKHFDREVIKYYIDWNEESVVYFVMRYPSTAYKMYEQNMYRFVSEFPNHEVSKIIKKELSVNK